MSSPVLLTLDDVKRLKAERDNAAREMAALQERVAGLDKTLDAVRTFIPPAYHAEVFGDEKVAVSASTKARPQSRKWAPTILPMLEQAGHGLTTHEIRRQLAGTPLEHDVGFQGGALYNALNKMAIKGEIVRKGSYYCLIGQDRPESDPETITRSVYQDAILRVLAKYPEGIRPGILNEEAKAEPEASKAGRSVGYFFKVLSRLVAEGRVKKIGSRYLAVDRDQQGSSLL